VILLEYIIVNSNEKLNLRDQFIKNFINTEHEHYKKYIATLKEYSDGMCYDGYLWDALNEPYDITVRTQEKAIEYLMEKDTVFVMWDIYSNKKVRLNDKIRLNNPKDTIISVKAQKLCETIEYEWNIGWNLENRYLPEDIYIFDDTMKWCVIFTHEGDDNFTNPELDEDEYIRICFVIDRTK
jgi:hypothetical protein